MLLVSRHIGVFTLMLATMTSEVTGRNFSRVNQMCVEIWTNRKSGRSYQIFHRSCMLPPRYRFFRAGTATTKVSSGPKITASSARPIIRFSQSTRVGVPIWQLSVLVIGVSPRESQLDEETISRAQQRVPRRELLRIPACWVVGVQAFLKPGLADNYEILAGNL